MTVLIIMKKVVTIILAAVMVSVIAAGCATSSPSTTGTPAPSASIAIKNFAFEPKVVTIVKGGTVTWTNEDSAQHNVVFGAETSPTLSTGGTYSKRFDTAGTFDYNCGIHPTMRGKVKVV